MPVAHCYVAGEEAEKGGIGGRVSAFADAPTWSGVGLVAPTEPVPRAGGACHSMRQGIGIAPLRAWSKTNPRESTLHKA